MFEYESKNDRTLISCHLINMNDDPLLIFSSQDDCLAQALIPDALECNLSRVTILKLMLFVD